MNDSPSHIIRRLVGDIVERRMMAREEGRAVPEPPDDLAGWLAVIGFDDSPTTAESFFNVASRLCTNEPAEEKFTELVMACLSAPSPGAALTNLRRYLDSSGNPAVFLDTIGQAPPVANLLVTTFGSSQYMSDILIRNPGYVYWLMDGRTWEQPDTVDRYTQELRREADVFRSAEGRLNAIRRTHRKSLLKIGVRDLLGEASVEETAEKLSNLADAVCQVVLEVVAADCRGGESTGHGPEDGGGFVVIALGKLGGRELNYSSDVDLVYVCESADEEIMAFYIKLARAFTAALSDVSPEGYLYRVDLRLRPDGQAGPLVNNETSMRIYYENRGRPWEFQAMLKARAVAGDIALGRRFLTTVAGLVFNPALPYSPLEDIARMRAQIGESIPVRERSFNIKLMAGGIRDIEFTAQAFQLMHGHRHKELRTTNTVETLGTIKHLKLMKDWQVDNLLSAYLFFRLVEHRLQMMHQIKTHTVPDSPGEIALLASRVSNGPLGSYETREFLEALSRHLSNVRTFSDSFFAGEDVHPHSVLLLLPEDDERANSIIAHYGVTDVRRSMHVLHTMAYGSFPKLHDRSTRNAFEELLPYLLEDVSTTGDPDRTLANLAQLSEASRREAPFYRLLKESPAVRRRVIAVAGFSSYLTKRLSNQMEFFEPFIENPEPVVSVASAVEALDRLQPTAGDLTGLDERTSARLRARQQAWLDRTRLSGFIRDHHEGRIAARLPGLLSRSVRTMVAETFAATVGTSDPVALFALGSYATGEPRMFSDLDVIVVSDGADVHRVTGKVQNVNRWFTDGGVVKLDFRLRGEGASAPLVQDIGFYEQYFANRMSLWEKVAFAKCRFWAGDEALATKFLELLRGAVARPFETEEVAALLRSRRSIETLAPRTQREWETKRSAGGRYDIEYLTAIGLAAATPGDDYEFSLDTLARLETLRDKGILDDAGYRNVTAALSLFTEVEYLMELQEFSLPRSDERSRELERYLSRSFEYWNSPKAEGVANALTGAKTAVRSCFDRFMASRA